MGATSPVSGAAFAPPQMAEAILPGSILATHSKNTGVSGTQPRRPTGSDRITPLAKTEPSHGGPLTYEDLVLPIEMPDIVQQRFNATAAVKSIQMDKDRFANTDKSRMEPMTATSTDTPNLTDTALFASQSRDEAASHSVSGQANGSQQTRMIASGSNRSDATSPSNGVPGTHRAAQNRVTQQLPFGAEPTLAAKLPAGSENTAGSLASTNASRNASVQHSVPANPADSERLPATESNRRLQSTDSPTRARHWIRQPN